jgi:hypothetical protein
MNRRRFLQTAAVLSAAALLPRAPAVVRADDRDVPELSHEQMLAIIQNGL